MTIEEIVALQVQFLPMPGGGTLIVYGHDRRLHIVLNSVSVDDLARQLSQRNTPPSHSDSTQ